MLRAGCVRCLTPGLAESGLWSCPEHGRGLPVWRPVETSYDSFAQHLAIAGRFPTLLPWPMSPGWRVSDFAVVGSPEREARATMTCCSGTSDLDGAVDVVVVTEEAGTGLGARVAGTAGADPGTDVGSGPPLTRVRVGTQAVALWAVSTSEADGDFDRTVLVGESSGRWLWMVLRPASAVLLLRDDWILRDVSGVGPPLVELPFGGVGPAW